MLVWAAPRELLGWPGVLLVAGFAVGVAPMIKDNLVAPAGQDSLSVFREISTKAGPHAAVVRPAARRAAGGGAAGVRALPGGRLRAAGSSGSGCSTRCCWWPPRRSRVVAYRRAAGRTAARVRAVGDQLALVAGAALTLLAYVRSPLAATSPLDNARYLSVLQTLAAGGALAALAGGASHRWRGTGRRAGPVRPARWPPPCWPR